MRTIRFLGLECVTLANASLTLLVTQSVGPRLLALRPEGGENLFAELPDLTLEVPGGGTYALHGGHRLWHAPEVPRRTYLPDDRPVTVEQLDDGLKVIQTEGEGTGLQKSLHVRLPDQSPTVIVDHLLTNRSLWPVPCAPWAITQLKPGGVAILPQNTAPADPEGVRPNRNLVLWPYSDPGSPYVHWGDRYLLIRAGLQSGAFKIGFPNPRGWLAYHREGTLFVKYAAFQAGAEYLDLGASSQCYAHPRFLELETLGPHQLLPEGETVRHREVWKVFDMPDLEPTEEGVQDLLEGLYLDEFNAYP